MAHAIGMQINLVLLGLSSGLQLGKHRYVRKVNQMAAVGAGEEAAFWVTSLESDYISSVRLTEKSGLEIIQFLQNTTN